jgi:hypothetical protein
MRFGQGCAAARALRLRLNCTRMPRWKRVVAMTTGAWLSVQAAVHASGELLLAATEDIHVASDVLVSTGERALVINGARIGLASGRFAGSLDAWLEEAANQCGNHSSAAHVRSDSAALFACMGPRSEASRLDWASARKGWARDLDLTVFGELSIYRATQQVGGLHVVRVRFVDALPLRRMFPRSGDAPGADLASVPRVPGSTRRLSAFESHASPMLVSYARAPGAVPLAHDQARVLSEAGFRRVHFGEGQRASLWARGDERVLLHSSVRRDEEIVSLLSLESVQRGATFAAGGR